MGDVIQMRDYEAEERQIAIDRIALRIVSEALHGDEATFQTPPDEPA